MKTVLRAAATAVASIQSAVRSAPTPATPAQVTTLADRLVLEDDIRIQMHLLLICVPPDDSHRLRRRIQRADLGGLWYLRSELVGLIAGVRGEVHARAKVAALDSWFRRGGSFLRLPG
ncbi:hypothetical protein ACPWT1_11685 [Ramlibacter sp. MMS24-I3-19]|uniref:hypothetical protein n=1 Tax=Ramlibacter sp. MMS24-I3-19 TaxID=3416606 RepID=UPI003D03D124